MKWPTGTQLVVVGHDPNNPAGEICSDANVDRWIGTVVTVLEDQESAARYAGTVYVSGRWTPLGSHPWSYSFYVLEHDLAELPPDLNIGTVEAFLNA